MVCVVRILAIADEVDETLFGHALHAIRPDVVASCGDLAFDYLEYIVTIAGVPLVYVPGNHDPDVSRRRERQVFDAAMTGPVGGSTLAAPLEPWEDGPGPRGCSLVDGRILEVAGLRVAGLGGSIRYRGGENQYTEAEMWRRARALLRRARWGRRGAGRRVDLFLTHSPPLGLGDDDDPAHRGFASFHRVIEGLSPRFMLHGHVHPYGRPRPDRRVGSTTIVNVIPSRVLEVEA
ncbi:metallophosphoesterase [soil metagenome]